MFPTGWQLSLRENRYENFPVRFQPRAISHWRWDQAYTSQSWWATPQATIHVSRKISQVPPFRVSPDVTVLWQKNYVSVIISRKALDNYWLLLGRIVSANSCARNFSCGFPAGLIQHRRSLKDGRVSIGYRLYTAGLHPFWHLIWLLASGFPTAANSAFPGCQKMRMFWFGLNHVLGFERINIAP